MTRSLSKTRPVEEETKEGSFQLPCYAWRSSPYGLVVIILCTLLTTTSAQFYPDTDNVCRDYVTGGYRCCDGFYPSGSSCKPCEDGLYGSECLQRCDCYNAGSCDKITGKCLCTKHWKGSKCTDCNAATYPSFCVNKCLHCYNGDICDPNKSCKCAVGWHGVFCDQTCDNGSYGNNCTNKCNPGLRGVNCTEPCEEGYYGDQCSLECPKCEHGKCDSIVGCVCDTGYTGESCSTLCPITSYGSACRYQCACVNNGKCDPISGNCTCAHPYSGTYCQILTATHTSKKPLKSLLTAMYVLIAVVIVVSIVSIILYRRAIKLRMSSMVNRFKRTPLRNEEDPIEFDGIKVVSRNMEPDQADQPDQPEIETREYHDNNGPNVETAMQEYRDNTVDDDVTNSTNYTKLKEDI